MEAERSSGVFDTMLAFAASGTETDPVEDEEAELDAGPYEPDLDHVEKVNQIASTVEDIGGRVNTLEASVQDLETTLSESHAEPPASTPTETETEEDAPLEIHDYM